jgi:diguanylate cyclase (GGDEF)-like protein
MLVVAILLSTLGGAAYVSPGKYPEILRPIGTVLLVAAYPALAYVLAVFIRRHTAKDRAAQFDALTLTSGVALLVWSFLLGPHLYDGSLRAILFPLGDLLCLGVLTRLLMSAGRKVTAGNLLGAGLVLMLIADLGYEISAFAGNVEIVADLGRIALYTAAGLAALHPSMAQLTEPGPPPKDELTETRLTLLGIASMIAPAVLLIRMFIDGEIPDLTVVALLSALTFLLVLGRMAGIMVSHRQALTRERALRQASAALVSAADTDAVNSAVRAAVADLLPEDTQHAVVLAVTITQEHPLSPGAAEQAIHDRAAGTKARLVATREVDWAVSVRLNQFPTTLRCPMVLGDRPTGDPLVGVLHVSAPADTLPGLLRTLEALAGQVALALERIGLSQEVIRRDSETYFRTLIQNTADVILIVSDEDRIRYASPSAAPTFAGDPTGMRLSQLIQPAGNGDVRAIATEVLLETHSRDLRHDPTVAGVVITLRDVTERRRLEQELTHQAFHDAMTGLANRVLFHDRLQHALARSARDGSVVGVLFIDLDDFKIVNDTHGHAAGDHLLISVAHRIAGALRADDTAARLGGDEFAALVENVQDPGAVEETAHRILKALAPPVVTDDGTTLQAVASIGITTTPEAREADELLRQADLALYVAKGAGKNQWRRYQSHLHESMVERLELRSALDHAVHEGQFLLAYQPIVDLATDETVGFEALVRWHHPVRGVVAPDEFLQVAEESGLIVPMGRWVIEQALHTVAQWRRIMPRTRQLYVSVNVSQRQFREPGFTDDILQLLSYAAVPPQALMLELPETLLADHNSPIWTDLAVLREHGVRVAIDDVGTGHSSLSNLRHQSFDVVKIDREFIDDMVDDTRQRESIAGILQLAKSLDLAVIAEGIETERHRELLVRMDCPLGQGYLLSSPVDGTEALGTMSESHPLVA